MEDSIFTKIIKGDTPCHKVYEDDKTLAFLDIDPFMPGHVLVVSKEQVDHIDDLPDELYQAMFAAGKKIMKRQKTKLGAKRVILLVMGYDVPHAHLHVIPCDTAQAFYEATGARAHRTSMPEPDHAALAAMAEQLAF